MIWTHKPVYWEDTKTTDHHWFSGIYKITKYNEILTGKYRRTAFYRAYFKPRGWKNWGNAVDRSVSPEDGYATLEESQQACERHANRFPKPSENDRF